MAGKKVSITVRRTTEATVIAQVPAEVVAAGDDLVLAWLESHEQIPQAASRSWTPGEFEITTILPHL
jgi:hypothetical protein